MESLIVENVRCFRKRQEVPLAPLTILVGENSTGKSTFLALVRLAWDLAAGRNPLDFNEEPFFWGTFKEIATAKRGRSTEPTSFLLGGWFDTAARSSVDRRIGCLTGEFRQPNGQPVLRAVSLEFQGRYLSADLPDSGSRVWKVRLRSGSKKPFLREWHVGQELDDTLLLDRLLDRMDAEFEAPERSEVPTRSHLASFHPDDLQGLAQRPIALAPVRSSPLRTYDPIRATPDPEGAHVPLALAQIFTGGRGLTERRLRTSLEEFGEASGLFDSVDVRRLGKGSGDPFQLQITIDGLAVNILDVGYGVSQALPILIDCLRGSNGATFLLQQPEVHLHPRAQAELGSLFGALTQTKRQRFVIETHSDYLVDRVRMDVRDGKNGLRPEDVSLLYFERKKGEVEIAPIKIDDQGNLVDPPPGYRRFFLEEERRFLGGW